MASVNPDVFQKFQKAKKLARQEGDGHEEEVEVREDEEQSVKLQEIIDLLVAAGYFRARIKGLSSFDKVVGGMTWCIESCNLDVDVDLLFQENSTIGQKIALTEKIVSMLPKMKCPHRIEPHQIQGLDFIHIYPVIQWLVKTSMEFRQESSEFVRSYAINQFDKQFETTNKQSELQDKILNNVHTVNEVYRPCRYYKRKNAPPPDVASQVQITLLEYGHRGGEARNSQIESSSNEDNVVERQNAEEESFDDEGLNPEELEAISKHYASLQLELKDGGSKARLEKQMLSLREQKESLSQRFTKLTTKKSSLENDTQSKLSELEQIRLKIKEANKTLKELEQEEANDSINIKEVEELVVLNENLKTQEAQFKEYCKKELVTLQNLIEETKKAKTPVENNREYNKEILELNEKLKSSRLQVAKKNRVVAALQRHIDDVPNRPELAQYQRRFLELYNQVSAKHKETKQYYTLYNTLEDTRRYMTKEVTLLNSISDSYPEAVMSTAGKAEFLKQFQAIVEGVKQSKQKVEKQLMEEKRKKDQLSSTLHILIEQQRRYVAAVRQLSIEFKKHENLVAQRNS